MPPIYRHVAANVPALTGGNGQPCYRNGAPIYQREMRFGVAVNNGINLSPLFEPGRMLDGEDPADFESIVFTASEINQAMTARHGDYCEDYYNAAAFDGLVFRMGTSYTFSDEYGDPIKTVRPVALYAGLVWGVNSWHWAARLALRLVIYSTQSWDIPLTTYNGETGSFALFKSADFDQRFRLGANGITLNFDSVTADALAGTADILAGSSITITAQYA